MKKIGVVLLVLVVILFVSLQAARQNENGAAKSWSIADDRFEYLGDTDITNGSFTVYRETVTDVMYVAQIREGWREIAGGLTVMLDPDYDGRPLTWSRYQELVKKTASNNFPVS